MLRTAEPRYAPGCLIPCDSSLQVKMQIDETEGGFGWTRKNEIINGRAAMIGFFMLIIQELVTGKGFLAGLGFLDFLYKYVFNGYNPSP